MTTAETMLKIVNGVVETRVYGLTSSDERAQLLARTLAEIASAREPATEKEARALQVKRDLAAYLQARAPEQPDLVPAAHFAEAVIGEPLPWPRALRARVLEAKADVPPLRFAAMTGAEQAALSDMRLHLLDLPQTEPDPVRAAQALASIMEN